jgi:hypothetical protein
MRSASLTFWTLEAIRSADEASNFNNSGALIYHSNMIYSTRRIVGDDSFIVGAPMYVCVCVCTEVEIEPDSSPDSLARIIDSQRWFIDLRRPLNNSSFWRWQSTLRVVQSARFVRVVIYAFWIYFNRPGPPETLTGSLRWIRDCQFTFIAERSWNTR